MLVDRFNPTDWLEDYHGPVKIVIAGADETIPPACGQNLYDRYAGPKALQIIPNASHGGTDHQSPAWWRDTLRFWQTAKSAN